MVNAAPAQARIEIWRGKPLVKQIDDISERIIDRMLVTLPLLNLGIGGATMKLINEDGVYTGLIHKFDVAKIFLWREGAAEKRIFEGRVMKLGGQGDLSLNEFYINLECEDYAQETIAPPEFLTKIYKNAGGKLILTNTVGLLNKCNSTTYIDPDNEIKSTHDIPFDHFTPYNAINKVCKVAAIIDGTVGFDAYTDPDGNIHVFKRNKHTSGETLEILRYKREEDIHPVRNKIPVYGAVEKTYPPNIDALCEATWNTYGYWIVEIIGNGVGDKYVSSDPAKKYIGEKSIKFSATASCMYLVAVFTFHPEKTLDLSTEGSQTTLKCWIWLEDAFTGGVNIVELWDGTRTIHAYPSIALKEGWMILQLSVGNRHDAGWFYDEGTEIGTFDWSNLKRIKFKFGFPFRYKPDPPYVGGKGSFWIDAFHFGKGRFGSVQEDLASQTAYEVRMMRPIIDDNLGSDAECEKLSKFHLAKLKDSIHTIRSLTVIGNNNLTQGYRQQVTITQEDLNATFRMLQIKHLVRYTTWETELTVNEV